MPHITGSLTMVYVADMDRSIDFYTNKLGFALRTRFGNDWAEIDAPGMTIALHPLRDMKVDFSYNMQMGFSVADIQRSIQALKDKGVDITFYADANVKLAPFTDPDGNQLYLWSM